VPYQPPYPPDLSPDLQALDRPALTDDTAWTEALISQGELAGIRAHHVSFADARVEDTDFSGSHLDGLRLDDCELVGCNLANVTARGGQMRRVRVSTGRLTGLVWLEGTIQDAAFRDCRIDLASFTEARLLRVSFEDCVLRDTDFREAQLQSVRFERCDLTQADFTGARLAHCELRGCVIDRLSGVANLRGAAMPWPDVVAAAGTFAAALGVQVLAGE
jgi:uncharacterized protein YjbI with pentapeptide repeats